MKRQSTEWEMGDDTNNTYIFDKVLESRIKNPNRSI